MKRDVKLYEEVIKFIIYLWYAIFTKQKRGVFKLSMSTALCNGWMYLNKIANDNRFKTWSVSDSAYSIF